jgi:hypothetical protein
MNKIKTFILGSAAATVALTGAQAADPIFDMKAPREPVYRCDITGFIELPGTDVCLKIGGFARGRIDISSKSWDGNHAGMQPVWIPVGGTGGSGSWGLLTDRTRITGTGRVNFDARTQTEFGTVRAFIEWEATNGGSVNQRHAFVQFGNWTFGQTWSTFDVAGPNYIGALTIGDNTFRVPQIRYTQPFGNGMSFSVAVEDVGRPANPMVAAGAAPAGGAAGAPIVLNDRRELPAFVAAIEGGGDWGSAKLAGVLLQNRARQWTGLAGAAGPAGTDSKLGWGVALGMTFNVPTTEGSNIAFNATYTDGACQYHGSVMLGNIGGMGCDNVVWGNAAGTGGVLANNAIQDTVERWNIAASYQHFWSPAVSTTIGGGYGRMDYGTVGTLTPGQQNIAGAVAGTRKVDMWDIFANVAWTPVSRTTFAAEVRYADVDVNGFNLDTTLPLGQRVDSNDGFTFRAQVVRSF